MISKIKVFELRYHTIFQKEKNYSLTSKRIYRGDVSNFDELLNASIEDLKRINILLEYYALNVLLIDTRIAAVLHNAYGSRLQSDNDDCRVAKTLLAKIYQMFCNY